MTADETKRLRILEQENGRLKKLVAERDLEIKVMKEIAAKNGKRARSPASTLRMRPRAAFAATSVRASPHRPIGALLSVAPGRPRGAAMTRMRELARESPRYGYRRIRIFLGRDGHAMSPERAHRR